MNETENNNLRTNADLISDNDTVTGILSSRNDVDCFKVNFTNNGSVTFRLTIPSDVDYRIRIFDGVENDATCIGQDIRTGNLGITRTVTAVIDTAHTYYIVISPNTTGLFNATSNYTLSMTYAYRTIDIPSGRTCNWNQFYEDITNKVGTSGCSWTSVLDVANIYGPGSYSPDDMPSSAWDAEAGVVWNQVPANCTVRVIDFDVPYSSTSAFCSAIRNEICNNRPVIVRQYGTYNGQATMHFVVAYGYTGAGTSYSMIKVFDPARSRNDTATATGRDTTLSESITFNSKTGVRSLYFLNNR